MDALRLKCGRGLQHVKKQRPTRQKLEYLGQTAVHTFAHAGSEDHDFQGHEAS